jgi:hypothetical protein
MRPTPRPEFLKLFLTEHEIVEMAARAANVARMSRLELALCGLASLARAAGRRLAYWSAWIRTRALADGS